MIILSNKIAHEILQSILDYTLDIAQKSLKTSDKSMRDILNSKMNTTLDLSLVLTEKLYRPKKDRAKKTTDKNCLVLNKV